jgi:transposase InsO family protein
MSEHHDAALTVASLQMAVATRGGDVDGVIFHSDRGSEYTAARYQVQICSEMSVPPTCAFCMRCQWICICCQ